MDTQIPEILPRIRTTRRRDAEAKVDLSQRRTWHNEDGEGQDPQTIPYAEFKSLQAKYNGLKGHSDGLQGKLDKALADLASQSETYEGQLSEARTNVGRLETEANLLKSERETMKGENARMKAQTDLTSRVLGRKNQALSDLLADGLLRTDGLDEAGIDAYLDKMATRFESGVKNAADKQINGAAPPAPEGTDKLQLTSEQMLDRLMQLEPGSQEYNTLSEAYLSDLK